MTRHDDGNSVMQSGPWLDTLHAAEYVGYANALSDDPKERARAIQAFWVWTKRRGVASCRRGRKLLFTKTDLDKAVGARVRHA
jgi:hypothetical protein